MTATKQPAASANIILEQPTTPRLNPQLCPNIPAGQKAEMMRNMMRKPWKMKTATGQRRKIRGNQRRANSRNILRKRAVRVMRS
jgi:hypothetical protein